MVCSYLRGNKLFPQQGSLLRPRALTFCNVRSVEASNGFILRYIVMENRLTIRLPLRLPGKRGHAFHYLHLKNIY
jgi:hypothetical protein